MRRVQQKKKIMRFFSAATVLLLVLFSIVSVQGVSITTSINASADSHVLEEFPNSNYGTEAYPNTAYRYGLYSNWNSTTWMKFSLTSLDAESTIVSAYLSFRTFTVTSMVSVDVYFCADDSWGELTITWNNQPSFSSELYSETLAAETWYNFTITDLAKSAFHGDKTLTFVLNTLSAGKIANFYSRETSFQPRLYVNYLSNEGSSADIGLSDFGAALGEKIGIGDFAGGLLMGLILLTIILFPVTLVARRRGGGILPEMLAGFGIFGINIAFGWWPVWMIVILAFLVALLYGKQITGRD